MKQCRRCLRVLPSADFNPPRATCRDCRREQNREYYAANRQQRIAKERARYQEKRESILAQCAEYRARNRERRLAKQAEYRELHKDEINARRRARKDRSRETRRQMIHRKITALKMERGGQCAECGYSRCLAALDFHHRDPKTKDFSISDAASRSLSVLRAEADKCDLICANCHRERHVNEREHLKLRLA